MDGIEEYRLKTGWVCRGLQILLALSLLAAVITQAGAAELVCLAVCVVNLALYMVTKMKYEVELGLSDPAIQILEAGKKLTEKAEIRYLKRILDHLNDRKTTLCVIDEILRGTNTGERIRASRAILEYLVGKNCIPLIASHDKELTVLLDRLYDNYHFSEEMGEDDISFSYKIMRGPATSQNAVKLLKLAGFPEEIIRECEKNSV